MDCAFCRTSRDSKYPDTGSVEISFALAVLELKEFGALQMLGSK